MSFKLGDRVKAIKDYGSAHSGETGTVCNVDDGNDPEIGVHWDKKSPDKHNCHNRCPTGHGYFVPEHTITKIDLSTATGSRVVKTADIGARVVRGKDWEWGDQDAHGVGTITGGGNSDGWVRVDWDCGSQNKYRIGDDGNFDLYYAEGETAKKVDSPSFKVGDIVKARYTHKETGEKNTYPTTSTGTIWKVVYVIDDELRLSNKDYKDILADKGFFDLMPKSADPFIEHKGIPIEEGLAKAVEIRSGCLCIIHGGKMPSIYTRKTYPRLCQDR